MGARFFCAFISSKMILFVYVLLVFYLMIGVYESL